MNNKGFTLIEVLGVLIIISIIGTFLFKSVHSTYSVGRKEAYQIMKNNIIKTSYSYIQECSQGLVTCDFSFEENNTFSAEQLLESGYFKSLDSPLDGKYLGTCLQLKATTNNGVVVVDLIDNCYE